MNLPMIVDKVITQLSSLTATRGIKIKLRGSKLVLQSAFGTKNPETIADELYWRDAENRGGVYLPDIYKQSFEDAGALNEDGTVKKGFEEILGFRIPSTELHSAIPLKILGFYPSKNNSNVIIAPKEIVLFHGSDYDIDALYIMRYWIPTKNYKNEDGKIILKQGELTLEKDGMDLSEWVSQERSRVMLLPRTENTIRYAEELRNVLLAESAKNDILKEYLKVTKDPKNQESMMAPISMDNFKGESELGAEESVFDMLVRVKGLENHSDLYESRDLNDVVDQMLMHQDNFTGDSLTGIFANLTKGVAYSFSSTKDNKTIPTTNISVQLNGGVYKNFSRTEKVVNEEGELVDNSIIAGYEKELKGYDENGKPIIEVTQTKRTAGPMMKKIMHTPTIWETYDSLVNAAIDNVKEQILAPINGTNNTAKSYFGGIALGIPLKDVVRLHMHPLVMDASTEFRYFETGINQAKSSLRLAAIERFNLEETTTTAQIRKAIGKDIQPTITSEWLEGQMTKSKSQVLNPKKLTKQEIVNLYYLLDTISDLNKLGTDIGRMSTGVQDSIQDYPISYSGIQDAMDNFNSMLEYDPNINNYKSGIYKTDIPNKFKNDWVKEYPAAFKNTDITERRRQSDGTYKYVSKDKVKNSERIDAFNTLFQDVEILPLEMFKKSEAQQKSMTPVQRDAHDKKLGELEQLNKVNLIKEGFTINNIDIFKNENINAGFKGLKMLLTANEKVFYKHHKFLQEEAKKIRNQLKFKQFNNKYEDLEYIRGQFLRYVLSGVSINLDSTGETYSFKTENTDIFELAKGITVAGSEAWVQRFVQKVEKIAKENPTNRFLNALEFSKRNGKSTINFTSGGIMNQATIFEFQKSFEKLAELTRGEELQYDFVKYDVLTKGLKFGSNSYALVLPPQIYSKVSREMDTVVRDILPTAAPTEYDNSMRASFMEHFKLQFALNNMDSLNQVGVEAKVKEPYTKKKGGGYRGIHNGAKYDVSFQLNEEADNASTFPLFIRYYNHLLMRLPTRDGDKRVMYQRVGSKSTHTFYSFDQSLFTYNYALQNIVTREFRTIKVNDNKDLKQLSYAERFATGIGTKGDVIILVNRGDVARTDRRQYQITNIKESKGDKIFSLKYITDIDVKIKRALNSFEEKQMIEKRLEVFKDKKCKGKGE